MVPVTDGFIESQHPASSAAADLPAPYAHHLGADPVLRPVCGRRSDSVCWSLTSCDSKYVRLKVILLVVGMNALFGGLEALLILTLRVCPVQKLIYAYAAVTANEDRFRIATE